MFRVLLPLLLVAFAVWALLDVAQTPTNRILLLPKGLWALVTLIPLVGALAWILFGSSATANLGPAARPIAPDDDPDFLRGLGRPKD